MTRPSETYVSLFPRYRLNDGGSIAPEAAGLTKREFFSALVLQAIVSRTAAHDSEAAATTAVKYADALIKRLETQ